MAPFGIQVAWEYQPTDLMASYDEDGNVYQGTGAALTDIYRTQDEYDSDSEELLAFAKCMLGPGDTSYFS